MVIVALVVLVAVIVVLALVIVYLVTTRGKQTPRERLLERDLDLARAERHEAFIAALRVAGTAGSEAAAQTVFAMHAGPIPDEEDELDPDEEERDDLLERIRSHDELDDDLELAPVEVATV